MTSVVAVNDLIKRYDGRAVVDGVSFAVAPGECFGILGPNGAGKTTTMRCCLGLSVPDGGTINLCGLSVPEQARDARYRTGVVPQFDNLDPDFTVEENLVMWARYFDISKSTARARLPGLLEMAGLQDRAKAKIDTLSGGMKRRLTIARALVSEPEILMLDEPTTGLDPQARHILWDRLFRLKEQGVTLLITTHYMDEAEQLCDRIMVMDKGSIMAEDSPAGLIREYSTREVLELRFGSQRNVEVADSLKSFCDRIEVLPDRILLYADDGESLLHRINEQGIHPLTSLVRRSSLEDVFLRLTGRTLVE